MVLSSIIVYPVKSLDGVSVNQAKITTGGSLEWDRTYAIVDAANKFVNGKRAREVQLLRSSFNPDFREITIWLNGETQKNHFSLESPGKLNDWLSSFFGFSVTVVRNDVSGFPDDLEAYGPTIVSEASLETVSTWFPPISIENVRRRFRSNLELANVPSFWEDNLFGKPGELKPFQIGDVQLFGHNPCQRCVVPTRDPNDATPVEKFQKSFMELRRQHLPVWSEPARFNHYYRFAINTSIPALEFGKTLNVGDTISL